ncbi:hypothetical protein Q5P01_010765 [Channa striata]|uniref:Uncharacterized protein n=1 Tax=Channa striata TaxID=64152 RepID=A0AA88SNH7_CHASR|nr:hypothetical protein Q5P01_010765 [Channa striata]
MTFDLRGNCAFRHIRRRRACDPPFRLQVSPGPHAESGSWQHVDSSGAAGLDSAPQPGNRCSAVSLDIHQHTIPDFTQADAAAASKRPRSQHNTRRMAETQ